MEVKCSICGKIDAITKIHKDYQVIAKQPQTVYMCEMCKVKIKFQASQAQKDPRPI